MILWHKDKRFTEEYSKLCVNKDGESIKVFNKIGYSESAINARIAGRTISDYTIFPMKNGVRKLKLYFGDQRYHPGLRCWVYDEDMHWSWGFNIDTEYKELILL